MYKSCGASRAEIAGWRRVMRGRGLSFVTVSVINVDVFSFYLSTPHHLFRRHSVAIAVVKHLSECDDDASLR